MNGNERLSIKYSSKVDSIRNKTDWYITHIKQNTLHDLNEQLMGENEYKNIIKSMFKYKIESNTETLILSIITEKYSTENQQRAGYSKEHSRKDYFIIFWLQ